MPACNCRLAIQNNALPAACWHNGGSLLPGMRAAACRDVIYITPRPRRRAYDESMRKCFTTGEVIAETGIYQVIHETHRLPREVILLKDERFPRCARCKGAVAFELINADPSVFLYQPLRIFELPVLEEKKAAAGEGK
jgi:hypothetical protein